MSLKQEEHCHTPQLSISLRFISLLFSLHFSDLYIFSLPVSTAIFAAMVRGAMARFFAAAQVPVVAFPFCIVAALFLLVDSNTKQLLRVPGDRMTYPEEHRKLFKSTTVGVTNVQPDQDPTQLKKKKHSKGQSLFVLYNLEHTNYDQFDKGLLLHGACSFFLRTTSYTTHIYMENDVNEEFEC